MLCSVPWRVSGNFLLLPTHQDIESSPISLSWICQRSQNPFPALQHSSELEFSSILSAFKPEFSTVVATQPKISHRKGSQIPPQASAQQEISNSGRKSQNFPFRSNPDAVTAQEPPMSLLKPSPPGNWEQKEVLGRTFPTGISSCLSKGSHPMDPAY